jgi:hypothetical protein
MLFRKAKYIGCYGIDPVDGAIKLAGNKILFPYPADWGNVIDLSDPIPHEILLGGKLPTFMPAAASRYPVMDWHR